MDSANTAKLDRSSISSVLNSTWESLFQRCGFMNTEERKLFNLAESVSQYMARSSECKEDNSCQQRGGKTLQTFGAWKQKPKESCFQIELRKTFQLG